MTIILFCYLLAGCAFQSTIIDYFLLKDTDGYRTEASAYVLKNVPPGTVLCFNANDKDALIDLAMFECQSPSVSVPLYHYVFTVPCSGCNRQSRRYAVCFLNQKVVE